MSSESIDLPAGFRYAGVACGIKPSGKPDLSLIVADRPVVAAGVYTTNQVVAAPVVLSRDRTPSGTVRAVIANSGNANACTGEQGMKDAAAMCRKTAELVGCVETDVLLMSTGVIGQPLPMDRVNQGITSAHARLAAGREAFEAAATAILTTDDGLKVAHRRVEVGRKTYLISAMAKGAGMIAPNMATMLAVVLTDAPLSSYTAKELLIQAANVSFNRVSVDGHTSTNDTLLLLSSGGEAGEENSSATSDGLSGDELAQYAAALESTCVELAKKLVADGEGAKHFFEVSVSGAMDDESALEIARTVAASPLVKTAITGSDPNWGRIVSAAGYAAACIDPQRLSLTICGTTIYRDGTPVEFDASALSARMHREAEVKLQLSVGEGAGSAQFWASDLTTHYVEFNSAYTT